MIPFVRIARELESVLDAIARIIERRS